ncbi:MAG: hypothetical protein IDH49_09975 [Gammaproteobacteria bacterium]|nr:hypothetical protein [Gammaproteobacteria bacterium]
MTGMYSYSAVLGDGEGTSFSIQLARYLDAGFRDFKIKLSGVLKRDCEKIARLRDAGASLTLRADANNLWRSSHEAGVYFERLGQPFWAIEEPLAPRDTVGLREIASWLGTKIILDESLTCCEDLDSFVDNPQYWVPNLRVSKLGGMIRSLNILKKAQGYGMDVIVGAHVGETSVLSRAGLMLAGVAKSSLLALEGAFGTHFIERDVCDPALMFGYGGLLDTSAWRFSSAPGSGLCYSMGK